MGVSLILRHFQLRLNLNKVKFHSKPLSCYLFCYQPCKIKESTLLRWILVVPKAESIRLQSNFNRIRILSSSIYSKFFVYSIWFEWVKISSLCSLVCCLVQRLSIWLTEFLFNIKYNICNCFICKCKMCNFIFIA